MNIYDDKLVNFVPKKNRRVTDKLQEKKAVTDAADVLRHIEKLISLAWKNPRTTPTLPVTRNSINVCLFDEHGTWSRNIQNRLSRQGYVIRHCTSVAETLAAFREKKFDLFLINHTSSAGLLEHIGLVQILRGSRQAQIQDIPIIVRMVEHNSENELALYDAGVNQILPISINDEELHEKIQHVVKSDDSSVPEKFRSLVVSYVDDSCASSQAIREVLTNNGHSVDHFSSAEEAYDALSEKPYDAFIIGRISPSSGMDTKALIESVRSLKDNQIPEFPMVVITMDTSSLSQGAFYRMGASLVLSQGLINTARYQPVQQRKKITPQQPLHVVPSKPQKVTSASYYTVSKKRHEPIESPNSNNSNVRYSRPDTKTPLRKTKIHKPIFKKKVKPVLNAIDRTLEEKTSKHFDDSAIREFIASWTKTDTIMASFILIALLVILLTNFHHFAA